MESLKIKIDSLGKRHLKVAVTLNNLGILYALMNQPAKASLNYEESISILQEVLGEKHKMLIPFLENYADFLEKQNFNIEASAVRKKIKELENQ